jgi:hypothetical protein
LTTFVCRRIVHCLLKPLHFVSLRITRRSRRQTLSASQPRALPSLKPITIHLFRGCLPEALLLVPNPHMQSLSSPLKKICHPLSQKDLPSTPLVKVSTILQYEGFLLADVGLLPLQMQFRPSYSLNLLVTFHLLMALMALTNTFQGVLGQSNEDCWETGQQLCCLYK